MRCSNHGARLKFSATTSKDQLPQRKGGEASAPGDPPRDRRSTAFVNDQLLSEIVVDAAIDVHRSLGGPGLLESVYEEALTFELRTRGHLVERQVELGILYKGNRLDSKLRLDMLVERCLIVECKATRTYNTIFQSQALTYLRLSNLRLALVINFGEKLVSKGIHRVLNRPA